MGKKCDIYINEEEKDNKVMEEESAGQKPAEHGRVAQKQRDN